MPTTMEDLITTAHGKGWQIVVNRQDSSWHWQVSLLKNGVKIDVTLHWPVKMDRHDWEVRSAQVSNGHLTVTVNTDHLNTLRRYVVRDNRTWKM